MTHALHHPLRDHLGRPASDPALAGFLAELGLEPETVKSSVSSIAFEGLECGMGAAFRRAGDLVLHKANFPPDLLVLSAIFLHAKGVDHPVAYAGILPFGLTFDCDQSTVFGVIGPPTRFRKNARWDYDDCYLTLDFSEDRRSIRMLTLGVPWRAKRAGAILGPLQ